MNTEITDDVIEDAKAAGFDTGKHDTVVIGTMHDLQRFILLQRQRERSGEAVPVGYVHLIPDGISQEYDVRFWEPVPMGAKLYASPLTAEQAAEDMKRRCMDIVKNWRCVHALEECCDHALDVALSEVEKLIESLPTSDTAMEEMRRDAERFRWLESNAFLEELDMDSQSIDEQIAIAATFESLDAIAAEKYQTEPKVTGSEN